MIYKFMVEGGPWMLPIVGVSVIALTFALERAWFWVAMWLRRDLRLRRRLVRGEVPAPGTRSRDPYALVLLDLVTHPDPQLAVDRARMLVRDSKAHLKVLMHCAGLGSSLGLFGTVVGMAQSFGAVGLNNPGAIISGLKTALNTTVLGLIVYLVAYVAHAFFAQWSANLMQDLEEDLNEAKRAQEARRRERVAA
jgi:biopolymer transport protein ExbB